MVLECKETYSVHVKALNDYTKFYSVLDMKYKHCQNWYHPENGC